MLVVVADASPLRYLILIGAIQVFPPIFEKSMFSSRYETN
jgi:hypothetical protein